MFHKTDEEEAEEGPDSGALSSSSAPGDALTRGRRKREKTHAEFERASARKQWQKDVDERRKREDRPMFRYFLYNILSGELLEIKARKLSLVKSLIQRLCERKERSFSRESDEAFVQAQHATMGPYVGLGL